MYIKSPYDTSALSVYDVKKYSEPLLSCILKDRNYEVHDVEDCKMLLVTGYDDLENDVPMFDHPIMLENLRHGNIVAVDLRKHLKKIDSEPVYIKDVLKDASAARAAINYGLILALDHSDGVSIFRNVKDDISFVFSKMISTILSTTISLNLLDQMTIEAVCTTYAQRLFLKDRSDDDIEAILKSKIRNTKIGFNNPNREYVNDLFKSIDVHAKDLDGLVKNLQVMLPGKEGAITSGSVANTASSLWYGPGGVSLTLASFEYLPSLITLVLTAATEKIYEKNRIGMIIANNKKRITMDNFTKLKSKLSEYADV